MCYDPVSSGFIGILPDRPMIIPVEVRSALELVYFELVLPQGSDVLVLLGRPMRASCPAMLQLSRICFSRSLGIAVAQ